jgi:hypothetical protein
MRLSVPTTVVPERLDPTIAPVGFRCRITHGICAAHPVKVASLAPTVARIGPYRFYFFSHEPHEPPHVHVDREQYSAKFWLEPVALARNLGYAARELREIETLVSQYRQMLLEAWDDFFGD